MGREDRVVGAQVDGAARSDRLVAVASVDAAHDLSLLVERDDAVFNGPLELHPVQELQEALLPHPLGRPSVHQEDGTR